MDYDFNDQSEIQDSLLFDNDLLLTTNQQFTSNEPFNALQSNETGQVEETPTPQLELEPIEEIRQIDLEPIEEIPVPQTDDKPIETKPITPPQTIGTKRTFDEMEEENKYDGIGDIIMDSPLSPKRLKLDATASTLARLSQVQMFSDITFTVRGVQFFGIKAMFAIKSELLQTKMYPTDGSVINELSIDDISAKAFRFIKDFCYELKPEVDINNIVEVLIASKIYKIKAIEQQCNEFLNQIDNVSDLLSVLKAFAQNKVESAEMDNQLQFVNDVLQNNIDLLKTNGNEIISSEIFKSLPFDAVKHIIKSDNLGVKEEELWKVCSQWHLNELKPFIRFNKMNIKFLCENVKPSGILSDSDLVSLYEKELGLNNECVFNSNERIEVKVSKPKVSNAKAPVKKAKAPAKKAKGTTKKKTTKKSAKTTKKTKKKNQKTKKGRGRKTKTVKK